MRQQTEYLKERGKDPIQPYRWFRAALLQNSLPYLLQVFCLSFILRSSSCFLCLDTLAFSSYNERDKCVKTLKEELFHEETFSTSFNDCSTFDWYGNRYSNGDAQDRCHRAGFLYSLAASHVPLFVAMFFLHQGWR